jgi:uncharacterized protein (TIGR02466 family)
MDIKLLFTSIVAIEKLNLDNSILEKYCRDNIQEFSQSIFLDLSAKEILPLVDQVQEKINYLHNELGFAKDLKQQIHQGWANLNNSEPINSVHCHPSSFFNAVYYVTAPKDGAELVLLSPVQEIDHVIYQRMVNEYNAFSSAFQVIKPEPGMLVIMPGWIKHYVRQHKSSEDRISMAFDSAMIEK